MNFFLRKRWVKEKEKSNFFKSRAHVFLSQKGGLKSINICKPFLKRKLMSTEILSIFLLSIRKILNNIGKFFSFLKN